jgi:hypothetical protein
MQGFSPCNDKFHEKDANEKVIFDAGRLLCGILLTELDWHDSKQRTTVRRILL